MLFFKINNDLFSDGIVVIVGDLFEKEEDLKDDKIWKDAGIYKKNSQIKIFDLNY